jgi:adenine-specific DNA-methyltransferase
VDAGEADGALRAEREDDRPGSGDRLCDQSDPDVLIICGFAFDPLVSETSRQIGRLQVLITRMNPHLTTGDTLLKNTGAGSLFTVFGEPDMQIQPGPDGTLTVSINGVDIYDPTTGEIRSTTPDAIACWFNDTEYNGGSFFVRHAYFTGGSGLYARLKRALKAEIDEAAWARL